MLINELFDLQDNTNKETDVLMNDVTVKVSEVFLKELRDPNEISVSRLSSQDGDLSREKSTEEESINGLNTHVVNDPCESIFSVLLIRLLLSIILI